MLALTASPEALLTLRRRGRPPLPGLQHALDCAAATVPEGPLRRGRAQVACGGAAGARGC